MLDDTTPIEMIRESLVSGQTPSLSPVGDSSNKDQQAPNDVVVAEQKEQNVVSDNTSRAVTIQTWDHIKWYNIVLPRIELHLLL